VAKSSVANIPTRTRIVSLVRTHARRLSPSRSQSRRPSSPFGPFPDQHVMCSLSATLSSAGQTAAYRISPIAEHAPLSRTSFMLQVAARDFPFLKPSSTRPRTGPEVDTIMNAETVSVGPYLSNQSTDQGVSVAPIINHQSIQSQRTLPIHSAIHDTCPHSYLAISPVASICVHTTLSLVQP
jgi:hypothetical protein